MYIKIGTKKGKKITAGPQFTVKERKFLSKLFKRFGKNGAEGVELYVNYPQTEAELEAEKKGAVNE